MNNGRFQAQGTIDGNGKGKKLEKSIDWAQSNDYHSCCGLRDLKNLQSQLSRKQLAIRKRAFEKAEDEVVRCSRNGGVLASDYLPKSFQVWGTKSERVDIEVRRGRAFLPKKCKKN
ncbi:hypothetical protein HJ171_24025 [Vibrio parahaemolyticus]|uniref:hypothetical protein n=1 Tax=Vibrio parahaemolyticus TaxID=670 RepID=UPI0006A589EB|nr:hypothetical protein [Vibrio parahaemolyticus]EHR7861353.1 hypothetical protein [Vibrio parahaemolyticus]EJC6932670.1 hypothetical protein [Vibrio parahaemolyticus]ELA9426009.1 hypothetical protein [Vibrio parahaemolyticus]MBE3840245.1 hypothetical protein [Vibrio parahaemolyticus]MBE4314074.1 hypothetical protein [Vibrio parahaemolyticus]